MTKHIRVRAGSAAEETSAQELAAFTPSFLWLLRDFYLSLEDGGQEVSAPPPLHGLRAADFVPPAGLPNWWPC